MKTDKIPYHVPEMRRIKRIHFIGMVAQVWAELRKSC